MKKQAALFAAALFAGSLFTFATSVHAADTTGTVDYTSGGITFDPQVSGDPNASLPTNLNFGSHPIQTKQAESWTATSDGNQTSSVTTGQVAVSDNRGTAGTGWSVKVAQPEQFKAGQNVLSGAILSFTVGTLTNNLNALPTGDGIANNSTLGLVIGQTGSVITAQANEGAGETALPINKFSLNVPANTAKTAAQYQTTVVWTFSATPS